MQIQMRDIPGFVDTRQQLLQLKSNVKGHWLGFAIAHHLNGNHALAVQILDSFEETQEEVPDNEQYEQSEMVMYKAMILKEGGQLEQALDLLQSNKVCSATHVIQHKWPCTWSYGTVAAVKTMMGFKLQQYHLQRHACTSQGKHMLTFELHGV